MILYFTGSGNSKYAADVLARSLSDETLSLNTVIKENGAAVFQSEKPFLVVTPIYAWRIPEVVAELLRRAVFQGNTQLYFVATMGSISGNASFYCEKLCHQIHMVYMGTGTVIMPANFVYASVMPTKDEAAEIIAKALPVIEGYGEKIKQGERIRRYKKDLALLPMLRSGLINPMFRRFMVSSKSFVVSDACIGCGLCAQVCPMNNVIMREGRPLFSDACVNCYACIHRCPAAAIDIAGKTEKHGRYLCPAYTPAEEKKPDEA